MRIFIAGATGVLGVRLVPLLLAGGHMVAGMTRSPSKADLLRGLGAEPVVCDVFDRDALTQALAGFGPEVVFHQLTDLPDEAADLARFSDRTDRMRGEGPITCSPRRPPPGQAGSSPRASPGNCPASTAARSPPLTSARSCTQGAW